MSKDVCWCSVAQIKGCYCFIEDVPPQHQAGAADQILAMQLGLTE